MALTETWLHNHNEGELAENAQKNLNVGAIVEVQQATLKLTLYLPWRSH